MEEKTAISPREQEVINLVMEGKSNKQIAYALQVKERTVEFHLKNIYQKLEVNSRVELVLKLGKTTGDKLDELGELTVDKGEENSHNDKGSHPNAGFPFGENKQRMGFVKEFAMSTKNRIILCSITILLGIVLIVTGLILQKYGAVVVGISCSVGAISYLVSLLYNKTKEHSQS